MEGEVTGDQYIKKGWVKHEDISLWYAPTVFLQSVMILAVDTSE